MSPARGPRRCCRGSDPIAGPRPQIVVATRNPKKLAELRRYLAGVPARLVSLSAYPRVPPVREDGATFEQNAVKKALLPSRRAPGALVVADDSGLMVDALGGAPGVRSARFAGRRVGGDGANNAKLLRALRRIPPPLRVARFVCVVAVARRGRLLGTVRAECHGTIAPAPRGRTGFGYDPVFIPAGGTRTFAELGPRAKDRLSHRARAMRRARPLIAAALRAARRAA